MLNHQKYIILILFQLVGIFLFALILPIWIFFLLIFLYITYFAIVWFAGHRMIQHSLNTHICRLSHYKFVQHHFQTISNKQVIVYETDECQSMVICLVTHKKIYIYVSLDFWNKEKDEKIILLQAAYQKSISEHLKFKNIYIYMCNLMYLPTNLITWPLVKIFNDENLKKIIELPCDFFHNLMFSENLNSKNDKLLIEKYGKENAAKAFLACGNNYGANVSTNVKRRIRYINIIEYREDYFLDQFITRKSIDLLQRYNEIIQ